MSTTREKRPTGQALLDAIQAKHAEVVEIRERHREEIEKANLDLAVLVAATREDESPDVTPTSAARVMGLHKQRAFQMIRALEEG